MHQAVRRRGKGRRPSARWGKRRMLRQRHVDPVDGRPGGAGIGTPAVVCAAGFGFVGYVYNLGGMQVYLDGLFGDLNRQAHAHDDVVAAAFIAALPYLGGLLGFFALYLVVTTLGLGRKPQQRVRVMSDRMTPHEFAELARQHGVEARVARETYRILAPGHRERMRAVVATELEGGLELDAAGVRELYGRVARAAGRDAGELSLSRLPKTLLALMQIVERRPESIPSGDGAESSRVPAAGWTG